MASLFADGTIAFIPQDLFTQYPALSDTLARVGLAIVNDNDAVPREYMLPTEANVPAAAAAAAAAALAASSSISSSSAVYPLASRVGQCLGEFRGCFGGMVCLGGI